MKDVGHKGSPTKATRASQLAAALRQAIQRGEMPPGDKLALDKLRDRHVVSLSPLREAMSRLVSSGLVEMEDQRGYRVTPVSAANLAEVTTLRATLEARALSASIANADLDWESAVLGALHRLNRIVPDEDATDLNPQRLSQGLSPALVAALREFHEALMARAGMPILVGMCRTLFDQHLRYLHLYGPGLAVSPAAASERDAIARAAVERDAVLASDLLARHLDAQGEALMARMAAHPTDPQQTGNTA